MHKLFIAFASLLAIFALAGCAGDAVIEPGAHLIPSPFVGVYTGSYSRGALGGGVEIAVTGFNAVEVSVDDASQGFFHGTGNLQTNVFSVTCTKLSGGTVTVTGTFSGSGGSRSVTGNISGAFSAGYTANFAHAANTTVYANSTDYLGSYTDGRTGTLGFHVHENGQVSGELNDTTRAYGINPLTGQVSAGGFIRLTSGTAGTSGYLEFEGMVRVNETNKSASGTYRDGDGNTGRWFATTGTPG